MTFLNPFGLAGLLSLPVIIALHLLFRRKKHYLVSHLGLWSFLDAETRGPQARRVPLTLILLFDLLIAALISLAWSRPALAIPPPNQAPRHWVILLDTSSSMQASGAQGNISRFEAAKTQINDLLRQATTKDVVTILTFGGQARRVTDSREGTGSVNVARLMDQLDQIPVGETGATLLEALAMGQAALTSDLPAEFHVVSDGSFPLPDSDIQAINRFTNPIIWYWVGEQVDNQAVLDLNTTLLDGGRLQVFARLANFGSQAASREVLLSVDGIVMESAAVDLPAESTLPYVWQVTLNAPGTAKSVSVTLTGRTPADDGLVEDNSAVVGLQPTGKIRVALVAENPAPLQQALQAVPEVDLRVIAPIDYAAALANDPVSYELTIFRNTLPDVWPAGKVLLVDLPGPGQAPGTAELIAGPAQAIPAGSLTQVSPTNPLVAGMDFSGVRWGSISRLAGAPAGFVPLLQAGGVPVLLQGQVMRPSGPASQAVLLLADLTQGNFVQHPVFPIMIANLVEQSRLAPIPSAFKTGMALPLPAAGSYQQIEIVLPQAEGQSPQPPVVRLQGSWPVQWTDTFMPGLYQFQLTSADGSLTEFSSGAQAGDIAESDLRPRDWTQSIAVTGDTLAAGPEPEPIQVDLRGWLLGAAILLFFIEAVLAWRR